MLGSCWCQNPLPIRLVLGDSNITLIGFGQTSLSLAGIVETVCHNQVICHHRALVHVRLHSTRFHISSQGVNVHILGRDLIAINGDVELKASNKIKRAGYVGFVDLKMVVVGTNLISRNRGARDRKVDSTALDADERVKLNAFAWHVQKSEVTVMGLIK